MNESILKKLSLQTVERALILNVPNEYLSGFQTVSSHIEVDIKPNGKYPFIQLFVYNVAGLNDYAPMVLQAMEEDGLLWISYPKKSSGLQTDISRDEGWDVLINAGLEGVSQVAIDETWSALRFRPLSAIKQRTRKSIIGVKKTSNESQPERREMETPEELLAVCQTNKEAGERYEKLMPSQKKYTLIGLKEQKKKKLNSEGYLKPLKN